MIENKEMQEAIDRIARSADGLLLYRLLQKVLCGTVAAPTQEGALQFHEGRRTLARDLMAYMAEGIADNDRACVTFAVAKPTSIAGTRGAGRRVTADTYVAGYDTADSFGSGGGSNGSGGAT
jgi:hypothetical protein